MKIEIKEDLVVKCKGDYSALVDEKRVCILMDKILEKYGKRCIYCSIDLSGVTRCYHLDEYDGHKDI